MLTPLQKVIEWTVDHTDFDGALPDYNYEAFVSILRKHKPDLIIVHAGYNDVRVCLDERDNGEDSRRPEECFIVDSFEDVNSAVDHCHKKLYPPTDVVTVDGEDPEEVDLTSEGTV
jgi:hypothetical protein